MKVGRDVERSVQWRVNNEIDPLYLSVPLVILTLESFYHYLSSLFSFNIGTMVPFFLRRLPQFHAAIATMSILSILRGRSGW